MRTTAVAGRVLKQFWYDRRTLGLVFLAPMLVLFLIHLLLTADPYLPRVAVVTLPGPLRTRLIEGAVTLVEYPDREAAVQAVRRREASVFLEVDATGPLLVLEGSDPAVERAVFGLVLRAFEAPAGPRAAPRVTYLYAGPGLTVFDQAGPVLIGFLLFFFVFITSGVSFLRERTAGTLERLMATPIRRWELVAGYLLGFGALASVQATVIAQVTVGVLDAMLAGPLVALVLVAILLALSAVALGMLVSAFAHNEFQMMQFIPLVIIPQFLFSGLFRLEALPAGLRLLGNIMPLSYGADALREIMIRGKSLPDLTGNLLALLGFVAGFGTLNVLVLRKHRAV
jgi:ABC-2 type transport system permease protein